VGALDIPDEKLEHTNRYEAVMPAAFEEIMRDVPVNHEDYLFIDVGSGKGRALLLASRFPFRQIIGVEISAALTEVALKNIRIFQDGLQKCRDIRAVCRDAISYEMPAVKTVLYLNNPFDDQVMGPFVSNLEKSIQNCSRKVFVVYQRPLHRFLWDQSKAFRLIRTAERHVIYESVSL
jgi:SAM-dependent methyltransferase